VRDMGPNGGDAPVDVLIRESLRAMGR
jgi:hypothetical protein